MSGAGRRGAWAHRGRVLEAAGLMVAGAAAQKWVPMRRWSSALGQAGAVPDRWRGRTVRDIPELAADGVEQDVAVAVHRALAHLPLAPSCLAQAFAAQLMLRRRGRGGVVVIGLRRVGGPGAVAGEGAGEGARREAVADDGLVGSGEWADAGAGAGRGAVGLAGGAGDEPRDGARGGARRGAASHDADPAPRSSNRDQWEAHAWLLGSVGALTGGPAAAGFTATTVFEVPTGLRAGEVVGGG